MGVLKLWRAARGRSARNVDTGLGAVDTPPAAAPLAGARVRVERHGGPADTEALDDLKTLERRYGPGVAPTAMRLRNAVLLHRAGRKAEAWAAFAKLLADPELGGSPAVRPALLSETYSKMRVAHEREGCPGASITPAVLSYVTRVQFHALQGQEAVLAVLRSAERFDRHFAPLLARARLTPVLPALRQLVDDHLQALPEVDVAGLEAWVEELRRRPPSAPARGRAAR